MKISDVLRHKGSEVITIQPGATVSTLLALLAEHRIGAVVVSTDGTTIEGIVSERDVVRRLAADGDDVLDRSVSAIMTSDVQTCAPGDPVDELRLVMTERRIRHVPVVSDGRLTGIISIGDVVKSSLDQLKFERDQLDSYVHQT